MSASMINLKSTNNPRLKRVSFPEGRVNDDHMLLGGVESNSANTAPFVDTCKAQVHMTMDLFVDFRLSGFLTVKSSANRDGSPPKDDAGCVTSLKNTFHEGGPRTVP